MHWCGGYCIPDKFRVCYLDMVTAMVIICALDSSIFVVFISITKGFPFFCTLSLFNYSVHYVLSSKGVLVYQFEGFFMSKLKLLFE